MSDLKYFEGLLNSKRVKSPTKQIAVTYTRISSEGQSNFSLDYQEKLVKEYCDNNNYEIVENFCGTHESAKTDDRKELKKVLDFVKRRRKSKNPITHLIVAYTDRISRSDENIGLYNHLTSLGLKIESAAEGALPEGVHGEFMQKMKLLYANYENNLRREKCVKGIREKISRGEVVGNVPMGYDLFGPRVKDENRIQKKQEIKINKDGKLLKLAWKWKIQGHSDSIILERLKELGMRNIYKQKLAQIWKKPFYCGVISNSHFEKPIMGQWEPLVSIEDFVKINKSYDKKTERKLDTPPTKDQVVHRPLQGFIYCPKCGRKFTGYESKKVNAHYYKCNTKGCGGGNVNTETTARAWKSGAHDLFKEFLKNYTLDNELSVVFRTLLETVFSDMNKDLILQRKSLKTHKTKLEEKRQRATDLYIDGKLKQEIHESQLESIENELESIDEKLDLLEQDLSNLLDKVDKVVEITSELPKMWDLATFEDKQILQKTLFPEGILYDKPNHQYRTLKVNRVLREIRGLKKNKVGINEKDSEELTPESLVVAGTGLEPVTFGL